ncbi:MAG TPA: helix-turn-helix domain-containing protein [Frankiaceae bacterium]|nr:helix-turn-helix domain-containing protein [Frankiaceae bacterium]
MASTRRVSRQREAGEATRRETRRKLLVAARAEFAERGYAAATVNRIAERADVAVQTLYHAWGSKRALLRAVMETAITGEDEIGLEANVLPVPLLAGLDPAAADDPKKLLAHLVHSFRLLCERASSAWVTYRDAAGADPDVAADWQQLMEIRRSNFRLLLDRIPSKQLRPGLTKALAADTAWVIASPDTHDQLVRRGGYSMDEFEKWVFNTLCVVLLRNPL